MPIHLLSLPGKDLQYALKCMDLGDLIAFSLSSNRTKNLVKDSKIQIVPIYADVYNNRIRLEIATKMIRTFKKIRTKMIQTSKQIGIKNVFFPSCLILS
ncbi:unnamed protein product [Caenorhabditis nigoni]